MKKINDFKPEFLAGNFDGAVTPFGTTPQIRSYPVVKLLISGRLEL